VNTRNGKVREGYPLPDCEAAWAKHRKWTRITWGLFLGWIPFAFSVIELLEIQPKRFGVETPAAIVFTLFGGYVLSLIIISNIVSAFRCPRCGARFYAWGPWGLGHNGFARKCRNCGLKKWQCDDVI